MATVIKLKDETKRKLKQFAVKKLGDDIGRDVTFDTIVSILLKEVRK